MEAVAERKAKVAEVLARAAAEGVRFVNLQFTDISGIVKSVTIPVEQLEDTLDHGKWFDGSSIEGFARIAESDMYLMPDPDTFAVIPWERGANTTARIICWVHMPDGELFDGDPRAVLLRVTKEVEELGYEYYVGPELEFFLLRPDENGLVRTLPHDRGGYFDLSTDQAGDVRKEMVNALQGLGIEVETSHHECAVGQHEIDFRYGPALQTADAAVTFKYTLKAVAQRNGLHATFMPKPIYGIAGSGMHVHQSFNFLGTNQNAFVDKNDEYGLSEVAKQFIAGQLHHARAMSIVLAPLVNSYKRLVPGYEAPVYVSWARINRSALIRVPKVTARKPESTRLELRCPDPSCNPYLAFAVMLHCGLDGIKKKMQLVPPVDENLYAFDDTELKRRNIAMLPGSLGEALQDIQKDEIVQEALGEHLYARFLEARQIEWDDYRKSVSQWEIDRYLETF